MENILKKGVISFVLFMVHWASTAQCAMCRATVENNVSHGDTSVGAGLNFGILYLFVMPYLLAAVIGFFWYKNAKKNRRKLAFRNGNY
jgi:hypothetical protein